MEQVILEAKKISKRFPGVNALEDVDFQLKKGEVRALIGKNGAGKSTLIKIITRIYNQDQGSLFVDGKEIQSHSVRRIHDLGIEAIYQEQDFVPYFTVGQMVMYNFEPKRLGDVFINYPLMHKTAHKILKEKLSLDVDPYMLIKDLNVSERQLVQLANVLIKKPKIMIFDEPTAPLSESEIDRLFDIIRNLKANGAAIIYISHRLEEIFQIADSVTIMRDGRKIVDLELDDTVTEDRIVNYMTGEAVLESSKKRIQRREVEDGIRYSFESLSAKGIRDVSFKIHKGEILGLFGAEGAGQQEIGYSLFGLNTITAGKVFKDGKEIRIKNPRTAIRNGVGYVPRDRRQEGLIIDFSVKENVTLANIREYSRRFIINRKQELAITSKSVKELDIKTPDNDKIVRFLSGGNQQKVALSKWLTIPLSLLILDYPTIGIDVHAKEDFYRIIGEIAGRGTSILLITPEYEEIERLCDRVVVIKGGKVNLDTLVSDTNEEIVLKHAIGMNGKGGHENK